jgi:hypothetical protein
MKKSDIAAMFGAGNVTTFLGVPACSSPQEVNAKAAIIGAPWLHLTPRLAPIAQAVRQPSAPPLPPTPPTSSMSTSTSASRFCPAVRRMPAIWVTCHMAMMPPPTARPSAQPSLPCWTGVRCPCCSAATTPSPSRCCRRLKAAASSPLSRSMPTSTGATRLTVNAGVCPRPCAAHPRWITSNASSRWAHAISAPPGQARSCRREGLGRAVLHRP